MREIKNVNAEIVNAAVNKIIEDARPEDRGDVAYHIAMALLQSYGHDFQESDKNKLVKAIVNTPTNYIPKGENE